MKGWKPPEATGGRSDSRLQRAGEGGPGAAAAQRDVTRELLVPQEGWCVQVWLSHTGSFPGQRHVVETGGESVVSLGNLRLGALSWGTGSRFLLAEPPSARTMGGKAVS